MVQELGSLSNKTEIWYTISRQNLCVPELILGAFMGRALTRISHWDKAAVSMQLHVSIDIFGTAGT